MMKFKDIVYKLTDKAIIPSNMGILSTSLYDWNRYDYYEETIPEVEKIIDICKKIDLDDEVVNSDIGEATPFGFYRKYVYYFIVDVPESVDITYLPRIEGKHTHRHWLNGKIVFIGHENVVYTVNLKKGYNIFCIEYGIEFEYHDIPLVRLECILDDSHSIVSLTQDNYWYEQCDFIINIKRHFEPKVGNFEFSVIPIDLIHYNMESKVNMSVKRENDYRILFSRDFDLKHIYNIELSFVFGLSLDISEHVYAIFKIIDKYGVAHEKTIILYTKEASVEDLHEIRAEASLLLEKNDVPELVKNEIHYYLTPPLSDNSVKMYYRRLIDIIEAAKNNTLHKHLFSAGSHLIYYYSDEDENYYYYYIVLPHNYDPAKKYPLLLTISHGHIDNISDDVSTSNYSAHFSKNAEMICADVGGRGCTLGSYMGELFILNEINHILNHFSVDKDRIYAVAHCAGNIALHNIAQIYPHLFAGIYTRRASLYMPNMMNLYNVPCMYLIASINRNNHIFKERKKIERNLREYEFLFIHRFYNADYELKQVQYTKKAINKLMSKKANNYPDIIYYRTERNRHRKAYYIEIESIKEGKDFAAFSSEIVAYDIIINTKNCTGIKITIPPQIDREEFNVIINKKKIEFHKHYDDEIFLKHIKGNGFEVANTLNGDICYYKGTGLLDVYLSPLRVINCNNYCNTLRSVSHAFAHPITNTSYPYIYADYPIKSIQEISNCADCSLIIVDNNCVSSNSELEYIRSMLPIQMNNKGYTYNGQEKQGEYCIMQVISNPWKNDCSILYVNTNNTKFLSANLFTRKVIIPSYNSGPHPFLNVVALLFDGNNYYSVKEWNKDFM